jgi:hypothetical protein
MNAIPVMLLKCKQGHEWNSAIPPWWAGWEDINCPQCKEKPYGFKWWGMEPMGISLDPSRFTK